MNGRVIRKMSKSRAPSGRARSMGDAMPKVKVCAILLGGALLALPDGAILHAKQERSNSKTPDAIVITPGVGPWFNIRDQSGVNKGQGVVRPDGSVETFKPNGQRGAILPPGTVPVTPPQTIRPIR